MQKLLKSIAELLRLSRLGKRWKKIAVFLAVIVVFCTTYMLILPAITMESKLQCGLDEHIHTDSCYAFREDTSSEDSSAVNGERVLICEIEEHRHNDNCYVGSQAETPDIDNLDEYTKEIVTFVIDSINALPSNDEVNEKIEKFRQENDDEGENTYLSDITKKAYSVYCTYDILGNYKKYVPNAEKLYELKWLWNVSTYALNSEGNFELNIYGVNKYSATANKNYPPAIIYGGSAREKGITGFVWWAGIVIDSDSNGDLYVSKISTTFENTQNDLKPSTSDGFVLYIWSGYSEYHSAMANIEVGDGVVVDFNYTVTQAYTTSSLGKVTFGDVSSKKNELHKVESAYTKDLVTINLFDYGTNINDKYNSDNSYPGFQQDYGTRTTLSSIGAYNLNFGNTITQDILAGVVGVTKNATGINVVDDINKPLTGAMSYLLGSDGYPVLANGASLAYLFTDNTYTKKMNTDNITGLFQQNSDTGEYYYDSHNNHAQFDGDTNTFTLYKEKISANFMMYPFGNFLPFADIENDATQSSTINGAYLSRIAQRSYNKYLNGEGKSSTDEYLGLYNALTSFVSLMNKNYSNGWTAKDCANLYFKLNNVVDSSGNYVIFSNEDLQDIYTLDYDIPTDFYFGMEIVLNFIQPKGGYTGTTGKEPLNFYFTGDDDVWIYLDGVLFLDLSGIHRHVGGEIDFVNGVVNYYNLDTTTGDVSSTPFKSETFKEILERAGKSTDILNDKGTFSDYTQHTLDFFYMERGSGSGVCCMNFNLPLVKDNTIAVTKELSVDTREFNEMFGNPDFMFQVLKVKDGEKTQELFIDANSPYEVRDSSGNKIRDAFTDSNGIIRIKAGETAVVVNSDNNLGEYYVREIIDSDFVDQYGAVRVDGQSSTTTIDGLVVGEDTFTGFESAVKDILEGHTSFYFNNIVTIAKLGSLKISKELFGADVNKTFDFNVTLDSQPIAVGTEYILIDSDGTESERTVENLGIISLKSGQSAVIHGIIAGTVFAVTESQESKGDYVLVYKENGEYYTSDGDTATGYILPSTSVPEITVTAINSEDGAGVSFNGTKYINLFDGVTRTYTIMLSEVTDARGQTLKENGTELKTYVTLNGDEGESVSDDFSFTLNYYVSNTTIGESVYYYKIYEPETESMVECTEFDKTFYVAEVTVNRTEYEMFAEVTALYKNGNLINDSQLSFTNKLIGELIISKTIDEANKEDYDNGFEFVIKLNYKDEPLNGTFTVIKNDSSAEENKSELTFVDGRATTILKHGESITVKGIPVGANVNVSENAFGYYTTYTIDSSDVRNEGSTYNFDIAAGHNQINFFNHAIYVLPETGGNGYLICYMIGSLVTSFGIGFLFCYIKKYRKRRIINKDL